jgi:hypothetical protein
MPAAAPPFRSRPSRRRPRSSTGGGAGRRRPEGPDDAGPAAEIDRQEGGRRSLGRDAGQERRHRDERPAAVAAGGAALAVLDHRRSQLVGRRSNRIERDVGQAGAVLTPHPGQEDAADHVFGLIHRRLD